MNQSLTLPCGVVLKNRIAKSAMSENMASKNYLANKKFNQLYSTWSQGGTGLLISGNVMVDSRHLGEPHNVVIEKKSIKAGGGELLKQWAQAGTQNQTNVWIQLNHPGKQTPKFLTAEPVAPSSLSFSSNLSKMFNTPRALTDLEIEVIIERFIYAAIQVKESGFTGVQIHGAHGYLVSQFLSPIHNQRTDSWGGSLENRMRFVMHLYQGMRRELGADFPISIKLNSSDFQKGGFSEEDSLVVAQTLSEAGMDLIEISGGTYEAPVMTGARKQPVKESTQKREAYFLEYCEKVRNYVKTPIMLTGGFRTPYAAEKALETNACDVIGLARALTLNPNLSQQWLDGQDIKSEVRPLTTGFQFLDKIFPLEIIWYTQHIHQMGLGKKPQPQSSPLWTVLKSIYGMGVGSIRRVRS